MSGHSKWQQIRRSKSVVDAKRGKVFTIHAKFIAIAARHGGDPAMNASLRTAIENAREDNMPNANIERAIKKGTGELKEGGQLEEVFYEGYGPGGVAILIHAITDNRNRTVGDIRSAFTKNDGRMGESGSVAWMFEKKGLVIVKLSENPSLSAESLELMAIDFGATDVELGSDEVTISVAPSDFESMKKSLTEQGVKFSDAAIQMHPKESVTVTNTEDAQKILKLIEVLEDNDDVSEVYSNCDIDDSLLTA